MDLPGRGSRINLFGPTGMRGEVTDDNGRNRCERREMGLRKEMMANTVRTEDNLLAERVLWKLPNNSDCWQDNSLLSTN